MKFKLNDKLNKFQTVNLAQEIQTNTLGQELQQFAPSEIKDTLKELNEDKIDEHTNMSSIDMKTRVSTSEESGILILDTLVTLNVLPIECLHITRQKKRLAVSRDGKGRAEMIEAIKGGTAQKEKTGIFTKLKNMF